MGPVGCSGGDAAGPLGGEGEQEDVDRRGVGSGAWAHPHLVVDQIEDGIVGDPVQGKAGQPLLQRLQQLLDRRPAGEQLCKEGPYLRQFGGDAAHGTAIPGDLGQVGSAGHGPTSLLGEVRGLSPSIGVEGLSGAQSRGTEEPQAGPRLSRPLAPHPPARSPSQQLLHSDRRHGHDLTFASWGGGPCSTFWKHVTDLSGLEPTHAGPPAALHAPSASPLLSDYGTPWQGRTPQGLSPRRARVLVNGGSVPAAQLRSCGPSRSEQHRLRNRRAWPFPEHPTQRPELRVGRGPAAQGQHSSQLQNPVSRTSQRAASDTPASSFWVPPSFRKNNGRSP